MRRVSYTTSLTPNWINSGDSLWYNWRDHNACNFYVAYPRTKAKTLMFRSDAPRLVHHFADPQLDQQRRLALVQLARSQRLQLLRRVPAHEGEDADVQI